MNHLAGQRCALQWVLAGLFGITLVVARPGGAATVAGATPGQFAVSGTGAATYTIPLSVAPGVAGMEPRLSLNYSSQTGNGLLGVGWSLSGLSAITRCPQTSAQDGARGSINFDAKDRFCLDGQRLIAVSGAYGASGTEYRTERDIFSKVVSNGTAGNGPESFTVQTKAGQVLEYGVTEDSRIEAQGKSSIRVWAVNKVGDTAGNYLTVTYYEDVANGQYYPNRIAYTGNTVTQRTPYATVWFVYETRPDVVPLYVGGSLVQNTVRLKGIQMKNSTTLFKEYRLAYATSASSSGSRLVSVTECASTEATADCRAPLSFAWSDFGTNEFKPLPSPTSGASILFADVNGDGRTDAVQQSANGINVRYATATGWDGGNTSVAFFGTDQGFADRKVTPILMQDVNGDGRADVVGFGSDGVHVSLFDPALGLTTATRWIDHFGWGVLAGGWTQQSIYPRMLADVDGDGLPDIVGFKNDGVYVALNTGSGFVLQPTKWSLQFGTDPGAGWWTDQNTYPRFVMDVTGDGLADIVGFGAYGVSVAKSNGAGFDSSMRWIDSFGYKPEAGWWTSQDVYPRTLADVNGDGFPDVVGFAKDGVRVALSDGGTAFNMSTEWTLSTFGADPAAGWWSSQTLYPRYIVDVNGDGKADIVGFAATGVRVALSTGAGFRTPTEWVAGFGTTAGYDGSTPRELADVDGDGLPDVVSSKGSETNGATSGKSVLADFLVGIDNGQSAAYTVSYRPLTDTDVYVKGASSVFPTMDVQAPLYVVSSVQAPDGLGGGTATNYKYGRLRAELAGRGLLGFAWVEATQAASGIKTHTDFRQDWPYTGLPSKITTTLSGAGNGGTLREVTNSYGCLNPQTGAACTVAAGNTYFAYLSQSIDKGWDLNGAALPVTTTKYTFDSLYGPYGDATKVSVTTNDANGNDKFIKVTTNTYANDTSKWFLGRLVRSQVSSSTPDLSTTTRTSAFEYHPDTGLLIKEMIEPDRSYECLVTEYALDGYGNRTGNTTRNCDSGSGEAAKPVTPAEFTSRTTSVAYDSQGRFPRTLTNALGHVETRQYDPRFGTLTSLTGPNGLVTTWEHDGFGRKVKETRADGTWTRWEYLLCAGVADGTAACPARAKYVVQETSEATDGINIVLVSPWKKVFYDALDRAVQVQTKGFTPGATVYRDTQYDTRGRVIQVSRPYHSISEIKWTTYAYDELDRVASETTPDGTETRYAYNGLTTTTTVTPLQGAAQTRTSVKDSQGQVVSVTDALGGTVTHKYGPFGTLVETRDAAGNTTTLTWDRRGRKTQMVDPDMGTWTYTYNALGELTRQTDPKAQTAYLSYDLVGRLTRRSEVDLVFDWYYDADKNGSPCGKGRLCQVGALNAGNGYQRTHSYDSLGRPRTTTVALGVAETYTFTTDYDAVTGRVSGLTWPTGFGVKYYYTGTGHFWAVHDAASDNLLWRARQRSASGQVTEEILGNGLTTTRSFDARERLTLIQSAGDTGTVHLQEFRYDGFGNLTQRGDYAASPSRIEDFAYDNLNRLQSTVGANLATRTLEYNAIGNLTSKSDVGSYSYPLPGQARPHGVTQAGAVSYSYDEHGNQTGGAGRSLTYTSFNAPATIEATANGATYRHSYTYGPEHERVRLERTGPDGTVTTLYLHPAGGAGLLYEKETKADGSVEHRHYVMAEGEAVGVYVTKSDGTAGMRYFHRDHLGSVVAVTDQARSVLDRFAYDAFGVRSRTGGTAQSATTARGFTGHEHLAEIGLVHMNGRIYDPALGRFLSADPYVQAPGNLQSLNRYAYGWNNPLAYTDPSGYWNFGRWLSRTWKKIWHSEVGRVAVTVAAAWATGYYVGGLYESYAANAVLNGGTPFTIAGSISGTTSVVTGASAGFAGGVVASGGSFEAGLKGAVSGSIFGGINGYFGSEYPIERIGANAIGGGLSSAIRGEGFAAGFRNEILWSSLTYANVQMREFQKALSVKDSINDGTGWSSGLFGDGFKLAGGRSEVCTFLGCAQNGPGEIFGIPYGKGSFADMVLESFAGPHDMANTPWFYDMKTGGLQELVWVQMS